MTRRGAQINVSGDRYMLKFGAALLMCIVCAGFVAAQTAAPSIEEVYLARDNGNGKAGEQAEEFRTTDVPVHCVILLDIPAKVTVKMNFVAVNVAGVKPETKVVTASYTTKETQNRVNFTGTPDGTWTPGRYRVDLFIDGKPARSVEFDIKASTANVAAANYLKPSEPSKPKPVPKKKHQ
jgi:hypothetical protein